MSPPGDAPSRPPTTSSGPADADASTPRANGLDKAAREALINKLKDELATRSEDYRQQKLVQLLTVLRVCNDQKVRELIELIKDDAPLDKIEGFLDEALASVDASELDETLQRLRGESDADGERR